MNESKINLTTRLRNEGRWTEASLFKDETIRKLRSEGMKRADASAAAWERMEARYPPLPPPNVQNGSGEDIWHGDTPTALDVWLYDHFGEQEAAWGPFVAKLLEMTEEWSEFEKNWFHDNGIYLDDDEKHKLHQLIADNILDDERSQLSRPAIASPQ